MQALFFYQNEMTLVPKCLVKTPSSDKLLLDPFTLVKDLCRYGRNTQICQLQGGGTQNPHSFTATVAIR